MVYLPAFYVMDEKKAGILKDYVSQGGRLLAEGGAGQRDTNSWLHTTRPGGGLGELFGVIENFRVVDLDEKRSLTLPTGETVVSPYINAAFQVTTSKVVAEYTNGGIAITENAFGKGLAAMTGFSPGLAYLEEPNSGWIKWLKDLAHRWAGTTPLSSPEETGLYVRRLESHEGPIYFLFNTSDGIRRWNVPSAGVELIIGTKYAEAENLELAAGQTAIVMSNVQNKHELKSGKDHLKCLSTNTIL
jgi:hypothetical protein